jgi:hypothetical protein
VGGLYDTVNLQWSTDESFAVIDGRANGLITNNYTINYLSDTLYYYRIIPYYGTSAKKGEYGVFVQHGLYGVGEFFRGFGDRHVKRCGGVGRVVFVGEVAVEYHKHV